MPVAELSYIARGILRFCDHGLTGIFGLSGVFAFLGLIFAVFVGFSGRRGIGEFN